MEHNQLFYMFMIKMKQAIFIFLKPVRNKVKSPRCPFFEIHRKKHEIRYNCEAGQGI